jgi:hypothetical protein
VQTPLVEPTYPLWDLSISISTSVVTMFYMTVACLFVLIGIYDYLRRAKLLAALQVREMTFVSRNRFDRRSLPHLISLLSHHSPPSPLLFLRSILLPHSDDD